MCLCGFFVFNECICLVYLHRDFYGALPLYLFLPEGHYLRHHKLLYYHFLFDLCLCIIIIYNIFLFLLIIHIKVLFRLCLLKSFWLIIEFLYIHQHIYFYFNFFRFSINSLLFLMIFTFFFCITSLCFKVSILFLRMLLFFGLHEILHNWFHTEICRSFLIFSWSDHVFFH